MSRILVFGLLFVALGCSSPSAQSADAAAPPVPTGEPGYVRGVLPLDLNTMVYQQNNVNGPPTELFFPTGSDLTKTFNPGHGLLTDEHAIVIDFPPQWEAKNLTLRIYDGSGEFSPGQRYYAVARGTNGAEQLVHTFTGSRYNESATVDLPPNTVYERLVLRGPKNAQPAKLEIIGDYRPFKPTAVPRPRAPLADFTGTNAFPWNFNKADGSGLSDEKFGAISRTFGGVLRMYVELEKFVPAAGQHQFQYWNLDQLAQRARADGRELLITFVHATRAEMETWPKNTYQGKEYPDTDASPYAFTADLMQEAAYKPSGEAAYQMAARYGFNARIPDASLKVYTVPAYPNAPVALPRKGLGYVRYYEAHNELDKDWKGLSHYMSGWKMGLHQSVIYDGAQGRMGPGCGIKTADPSAVVLNAGLAKATPDAFRGMVDCWKKTRGYKADGRLDIPLDQWNYHQYASDGGSAQHGGQQTRGIAPENSHLGAAARRMVAFSALYGGGKPVVLTETGYDVHPLSPLAAIRAADVAAYPKRELIPAVRIQRTQGLWTLRTLLEVAAHGIDGIAWYQAFDDNGALPYVYQSCGLLNPDNTRRPAADFLLQTRTLMGKYTFRERRSENPRVDIWENGTARMAVLWLPVESDQVGAYSLPLKTKGILYTLVIGAARMAEGKLPTKNGVAVVPVSETPVFVPLSAD
ncbi:hypothetical protein I2I05_09805 [Hymenobacter sp. BT683]|uniref:Uncharacterized protein n=1 Tax=Hymenobacter jeongseonensis TaxID=2791027 RepID=A0ABS0IHN6_9BACT|nr:hypothetical protein [Hymenobacter jeongseonensis]MBF9237687.1 hypothetical protein [Hymenobacter jeongseonensis]